MTRPGTFTVSHGEDGEGRVVLRVDGDLDLATSRRLAREVEQALATPGLQGLVFDLCGCPFIDSSGVAVLVRTAAMLAALGSPFVVVTSSPAVLRTLTVTGVSAVLTLVDPRDTTPVAGD